LLEDALENSQVEQTASRNPSEDQIIFDGPNALAHNDNNFHKEAGINLCF